MPAILYLVPSDIDPFSGGTKVAYYGFATRKYSSEYAAYAYARLDYNDIPWQDLKSKELARLSDLLVTKENYNPGRNVGWIAWLDVWPAYGGANPFLIQIVKRPQEMAESAVEILWNAFTRTVSQAEKATATLGKRKNPHRGT